MKSGLFRKGTAMVAVVLAALSLAPFGGVVWAQGARPIGDIRVFTTVGQPGQPAGIAVNGNTVLVTTLGMVTQPVTDPRLFTYDLKTAANTASISIPRMMPVSLMQLYGVAVDSQGRAYVVDMNGRILRIDPASGEQELYAEFPPAVGGTTTMPFDIVFDGDGFAYVTDQNLAAIWRVPPGGGDPELWFQDPRLVSYLFGPTGIRLDATRRLLYFTVARSMHPATANRGLIFRLPIDSPQSSSLIEVFRYEANAAPFGIEVGASGKLYVTLAGPSQISIVRPDGTEERRFPTAQENSRRDVPFDRPVGVAFDGQGSILVTNSNALSVPNPTRMVVFDIYVDDLAASQVGDTSAEAATVDGTAELEPVQSRAALGHSAESVLPSHHEQGSVPAELADVVGRISGGFRPNADSISWVLGIVGVLLVSQAVFRFKHRVRRDAG